MGKIVLMSLNLLAFLTYKFFLGGDVQVTQVYPEQVTAGEKFNVEVIINKGEHEGFAKWQQELPEGLVASSIESEGATFSFKRNTVKLIWMALPDQESFVIKYQIETDPTLSGTFSIDGKFSFIEDNERRDVAAATHLLLVNEPEMMAGVNDEEPADTLQAVADSSMPAIADETIEEITDEIEDLGEMDEVEEMEIAEVEEIESEDGEFVVNQRVTNTKKVKVVRKIKLLDAGKYLVELSIDKDGYHSFGKVEEYIPRGYVANAVETNGGRFSTEKNVLKILWMALPKSSEMVVRYEMQSEGDELDSATVHGVFSYLKGEESVQLAMKGSRFPNTFEGPSQLMAEEIVEPEPDAEMQTKAAEDKAMATSASNADQDVDKEVTESNITSVPDPETEVRYRIQIAAAKKEVGKTYFEQRHGMMDEITIDFHANWFKYMVGSYGVYKQARDRRNEIWEADNKIKDAFVCAYNAGERITVQEALMITKQKWYK